MSGVPDVWPRRDPAFFQCRRDARTDLASLHNISYYQRLMQTIRIQIEQDTFDTWASAFVEKHKNEVELTTEGMTQ